MARLPLFLVIKLTTGMLVLAYLINLIKLTGLLSGDYSKEVQTALALLQEAALPASSLEAFDLSVNHLQRIPRASGAPPDFLPVHNPSLEPHEDTLEVEDFLPMVDPTQEPIQLRFRLRPKPNAANHAIKDISAYRIVARTNDGAEKIWDTRKVLVKTLPLHVEWTGPQLKPGTIVRWRVSVWDYDGTASQVSEWSKFAVGPSTWKADWKVHPYDAHQFDLAREDEWGALHWWIWEGGCARWKDRRPLPMVRGRFQASSTKGIRSALLVASGLGYFSVSLNGEPLSSSSPLDPAVTDFSQRVSYRGFDITSQVRSFNAANFVVGISLGSGWWDGRPLPGLARLHLLPRGPAMSICELHITYTDGSAEIKEGSWQIAKGYLRDSDLMTGDTVDLTLWKRMEGWDTPTQWSTVSEKHDTKAGPLVGKWVLPVPYEPDVTTEDWRKALHLFVHKFDKMKFRMVQVGKLIPATAPPVLPLERLSPESIESLGDGRWLVDFGKAMSGVIRFDDTGLPVPIIPKNGYPRAHNVTVNSGEKFITVVYAEAKDLTRGDLNLYTVAGNGQQDGPGYPNGPDRGPCYPTDHGGTMAQRDVWIVSKGSEHLFSEARQARFTTHGFRFAEICCTKQPPANMHAVLYRTAFLRWGEFDSSNVNLNGAYELTYNAFTSNILSTQTDCPHRERMQYGGDIMANSPAAMHFFDMGAFYKKVILDWLDTQWDNGAYTETAFFQHLNQQAGIGEGAGETVWASLPPILTVRHMQQYGDMTLLEKSFGQHVKWMHFLRDNWERGMNEKFGKDGDDLRGYNGDRDGLSDWLSLHPRDTWLTHNAYFMASARAVAYASQQLVNRPGGTESWIEATGRAALGLANEIQHNITRLYVKNGAFQLKPFGQLYWTPNADLGLFAKLIPGDQRCSALGAWLKIVGDGKRVRMHGKEEQKFFNQLKERDLEEALEKGLAKKEHGRLLPYRSIRHNMPEGILAIRYTLKALSDMGFHNIALGKASGEGAPSFEYMMSHNGTTMWETWGRCEEVMSRNHPMFGAVAEWLPTSVAGLSLAPTTVGGQELLFWPRIPLNTDVVKFASATQGTKRGDASIAWQFRDTAGAGGDGVVKVQIRVLVPPATSATLRLPMASQGNAEVRYATQMPDLLSAKSASEAVCKKKRKDGKGFAYNWEYDRTSKIWSKRKSGKSIGTPCKSYLFMVSDVQWSKFRGVMHDDEGAESPVLELKLDPGLYDVKLQDWKLEAELPDEPGYSKYTGDLGPYCEDPRTFIWDTADATHII